MEDEPLDSRGRNITLAVFGLIVVVIAALVISNYRTKAGWVRDMQSDNVEAQRAAATAMMRKGQVAEQLQGDRPSVRSAAVRALRAVGTTAAAEQIIQFFKDPDQPIKDQAKQAVVALGPQVALAPTVKALGDSDDSVRGRSDEALREWHDLSIDPVAQPNDPKKSRLTDADAGPTAATCLKEIGKQNPGNTTKVQQAIYPFLDLRTPGVDEVVQVRVVQLLDGLDNQPTSVDSVPQLIRMLQYPQTERAAVGALGRKKDKRATLALLPVLQNPLIRSETVIALGKIADPRAVPELVKLLGSYSEQVRSDTAEALRYIGPPAVPALLVAVKSPDAYTRASAVTALGGIAAPAAQSAALAALKDKDANVRVAAATTLRQRPSPGSTEALIAAFDDPDGRVSDAAAETLTAIGKPAIPRLVASLDMSTNPARAYYANRALHLLASDSVGPLIQALRNPDPDVAAAAARILGDLGNAQAVGPLRTAAASSTSPEVRWAAERSARQLGGVVQAAS